MYFNYLKIAIRNILRHKVYAVINIGGLALGMAAFIIIYIIVSQHLNYDSHFSKADRIYRVNVSSQFENQTRKVIKTPILLAETLPKYSQNIENTLRIIKGSHKLVSYQKKHFTLSDFYYADESFFELFDVEIINGNRLNPLKDSASIVITEEIAEKYFGTENPIGKELSLDNGWKFKVSAVCKPFPRNSHFKFAVLADLKVVIKQVEKNMGFTKKHQYWQNDMVTTYFLLKKGGNLAEVDKGLNKIIETEIVPYIKEFTGLTNHEYYAHNNFYFFQTQALTDIHTGESIEGEFEPAYSTFFITVFVSIALIILILACINFMNLATARSSTRAVEIAMRKVAGATRKQLIFQFLAESVLLSFLSLLFSLIIIEFIFVLGPEPISPYSDYHFFPFVLIFTFIVGIFAGSYPAFYLSNISVINSLHGKASLGIKSLKMRRFLVVLQLAITFIILISRGVIIQQIDFFYEKNFGFEKDRIYVLKRAYVLDSLKSEFVKQLKQNKNIVDASFINAIPGEDEVMFPVVLGSDTTKIKYVSELVVDKRFNATFGVKILQKLDTVGENFDPQKYLSINQSAANLLNIKDLNDTVSVNYFFYNSMFKGFRVGEIVEDFHFQTLYNKIKPTILRHGLEKGYSKYLAIRIKKKNSEQTIQFINQKWNDFVPDNIFELFPMQKQVVELYRKEHNTAVLFILFSVLAVIIATMGIFGLTAFSVAKRTREIGIRKAFGTPITRIIYMLSVEFITWLIFSFVIASPLAYFIMLAWLDRFAYHVEIDWIIFAQAGIFMFLITLITVIFYAFKAARKNPAIALRHE